MTIEQIKQLVQTANIDILEAAITLKKYKDEIEELEAVIKPLLLNELEKYNKKAIVKGFTIQKINKTKFDYSVCNSTNWNKLNNFETELKKQKADEETFLKSLRSPTLQISEDGEPIEVYPPAKQITEYYTISKK